MGCPLTWTAGFAFLPEMPSSHLCLPSGWGRCLLKQALGPTLLPKKPQEPQKGFGPGVRPAGVWVLTTLLPTVTAFGSSPHPLGPVSSSMKHAC